MAGTLVSLRIMATRLLAAVAACTAPSSSLLREAAADLEKLSRMLGSILPFLGDAERKGLRDRSVQHWLGELRSFAYDAEDALEELELALLRHRIACLARPEATATLNARKRKASDTPTSPLSDASFQHGMALRVKGVTERLEEIELDRRRFHLKEEDARRRTAEPRARPPAGSLVDESRVYGREADRAKVLELLLGEQGSAEAVAVVCVIGMGGVGKTTLAQLVYRDAKVRQRFGLRSWVSVSENFDLIRLMRAMVESITRERCGLLDLAPLQQAVSDAVRGRRLLLVLDDVWSEEKQGWDPLRASLAGAVRGSKIMITSRSQKVSAAAGAENSYELECLSDEDSWSLFCRRAFANRQINLDDGCPSLASIGLQIVRKCRGLPLAVKMLGGFLRFESDEDRWRDVLRSDLWDDFTQGGDDILPVLRLSYHQLSPSLKQCFAYCAVFPRDCDFTEDEVIRMWMAQGLIQPAAGSESMEDTGRGYFDDLLRMSFLQPILDDLADDSGGDTKFFAMHDLIHDLARSVAGKECSAIDVPAKSPECSGRIRHSSLSCKDVAAVVQLGSHALKFEAMRTILLTGPFWLYYHLDFKIVDELFLRLKYLRVLEINFFSLSELPQSIGNLKHLRYLGLTGSGIKKLPESICGLHNLQTLQVHDCTDLRRLPAGIKTLINLRHLGLHLDKGVLSKRRTVISSMPSGIGHLVGLQTLSVFVVDEKSGCAGIEELKDLNELKGELCLFKLHKVVLGNAGYDAREPILGNKKDLDKLHLQWGGKPTCEPVSVSEQQGVLEVLQPHPNIQELRISHYGGITFPSWMGDPSFLKLTTVELCYCNNCKWLPHLGRLPSLKSLYVEGLQAVQCVSQEVFGNTTSYEGIFFPSLETLTLFSLPKLEELFYMACGFEFPRLDQLIIHDCPKLKSLCLHSLPAAKNLHISECGKLTTLDCLNTCLHSGLQQRQHTSLQNLVIRDCSKLGFPENQQLPATLQSLDVTGCPLLEQWCQRHHGKIEHVPELKVEPPTTELTLKNVYTVEDAKSKILKNAEELEMLELQWDLDDRFLGDGSDEEVLENLQPHTNIDTLVINGYRGLRLASWIWDPSFANLRKVTLTDCLNCERLPPLGRLPLLEDLYVYRMAKLDHVGHQVFGGISGFLSLKTLEFHEMPEWKEWQGEVYDAFPQLTQLTVDNCPKLRCLFPGGVSSSPDALGGEGGNMPNREELRIEGSLAFPRLSKLTVARCPMIRGLDVALPMMTSLYYLTLKEFDGGQIFHQLRRFPRSLRNLELLDCNGLAEFLPQHPSSLHDLRLQGCQGMVSFGLSPSFTTIRYLWIEGMPGLSYLPLNNLHVLKVLYICDCPELIAISCGDARLSCPPGLHHLSSLQAFSVSSCPKLELSPDVQMPSGIQYVNFGDCPALTEWCQRDWSASAQIRKVWIDGVEVFTAGEATDIKSIDDAIVDIDSNDLDANLCQEWVF